MGIVLWLYVNISTLQLLGYQSLRLNVSSGKKIGFTIQLDPGFWCKDFH